MRLVQLRGLSWPLQSAVPTSLEVAPRPFAPIRPLGVSFHSAPGDSKKCDAGLDHFWLIRYLGITSPDLTFTRYGDTDMHTLANIALVNRDGSDFSDLNTDLDAQQLAPTADEQAKAFYGVAKPQEAVICPKCKGSGRFRSSGGFRSAGRDVGPCFPCGGSGSVSEEKAASMRTYQKGQAT